MTNEQLTNHWNSNFPDLLPIAYVLKNKFSERWLRIHTLPESKRYAENELEFDEIRRRHNFILSELFGEKNSFVLITKGYGFNIDSVSADEKLKNLGLQKNFWMSIDVSDEEDEKSRYWNLFFDELKWHENDLDGLFRLVADEEINEVILYSIGKNIIYHPYDGGADIIFENTILRDKYKTKYKDWLSKHPRGL